MNPNSVDVEGWGERHLAQSTHAQVRGAIRELHGHPENVAKIFHPGWKNIEEKRDKVTAMVRNRATRHRAE